MLYRSGRCVGTDVYGIQNRVHMETINRSASKNETRENERARAKDINIDKARCTRAIWRTKRMKRLQ